MTTISPILIEALARRARKTVDAHKMEVDIADFRDAFTDELARFNTPVTPVDAPKRVSMVPTLIPLAVIVAGSASAQPSLGKGLGQQTGGTAQSDAERAITLLKMIGSCAWDEDDGPLDSNTRRFIKEQFERHKFSCQPGRVSYTVTGKQLHWLSDAKDKLVEKGIL